MKTIGYCSKIVDSIEPVFTLKDALYRNLDSQQISGSLKKFPAFGGKISRGGGRIDPPPGTGRVKLGAQIFFTERP